MIKKKYRLKKSTRGILVRTIATIIIFVIDVVLYHYLCIYGSQVNEYGWAVAFCFVGWFWLLAGQFMILYIMWEE